MVIVISTLTLKEETMKNQNPSSYTETHEIRYINNIGTHMIGSSRFTKLELLKKYRNAIKKRVVWNDIDSVKVINYVNKLITAYKD